MIGSVLIPSSSSCASSSSLLFDLNDIHVSIISSPRVTSTICCSSRSHAYIPKLEPFSKSKIDRGLKEPSLIQKSKNEISDYCSTLEGDASYSCWKAYFELKDLEKEYSKEDIENLILQSDGVKSLIGCIHGISAIQKMKKKDTESLKVSNSKNRGDKPFPIPDGLPKSQQELEEEEKGKMPDSPYTRLLRTKGRFPAWFSPVPDHQTD